MVIKPHFPRTLQADPLFQDIVPPEPEGLTVSQNEEYAKWGLNSNPRGPELMFSAV